MNIKIDNKRDYTVGLIAFVLIAILPEYNFAQSKVSRSYEQKEKFVKSVKRLAFCKCLQNGYYNDSALRKDPSCFIISDVEIGNFGYLEFTDSLAKSFIDKIPKYKPGRQSESMEVKPIIWYCIEFYESKNLDSEVRKFVKDHTK